MLPSFSPSRLRGKRMEERKIPRWMYGVGLAAVALVLFLWRGSPREVQEGRKKNDVDVWMGHKGVEEAVHPGERFLAYSTHSGYHNQRISLENALTLAHLLNRTLLLPPVWLGTSIPYISFDKMLPRLEMASKDGLEHCAAYTPESGLGPLPAECTTFFDWTMVHWDFMVDLGAARELVRIRDRPNPSVAYLEKTLGVKKADTYTLADQRTYQYRYYDDINDGDPLGKFEKRIDIEALKRDTERHKLLLVNTLFGTQRLRLVHEESKKARKHFRKSMLFRNDIVDDITRAVRDRLGGTGNYYGLHLRVGDGVFLDHSRANMEKIWGDLCVLRLRLGSDFCNELGALSWAQVASDSPVPPNFRRMSSTPLSSPATRKVKKASHTHLKSLQCRAPLHTEEHMLAFNVPLFIATDSRNPSTDPNLLFFMNIFPCTFVVGDFLSASKINPTPVPGLGQLGSLRNAEDNVPIGSFLFPQLDAQISAYGQHMIGTPQSTFSRFAVDILHQVYHGRDIVERN